MGVAEPRQVVEQAHQHLLRAIELLMAADPEDGTAEAELFVRLVDAVEAYERVRHPLPVPEEQGAGG